jgi:filamentous hemagglutinin
VIARSGAGVDRVAAVLGGSTVIGTVPSEAAVRAEAAPVGVPAPQAGEANATRVSTGAPIAAETSTARAGATRTIPMVVRTSSPNVGIPRASLFNIHPEAGSHYVVETDPRFANYRNWLSSDYLLNNLGQDPNNTLKRLGDGFYEQKLIREQVAQLTGYRFLEGFASDDDQYIALMNSGATFAKQYGLRPGIALSAAQMAQLTSDIVWLVEQTVTLPHGSTQQALAPQVYVRVRPGDIDGSGALLSADATVIKSKGDMVNTGTIAGRTLVAINAQNVKNLGGRIAGGSVGLNARNDLENIGGSITARDSLKVDAGRDIDIRSTAQTSGFNTSVDRIAGLYVTNPGGMLTANAGRDVNSIGAVISNQGEGGYTSIAAGNDINLGTVTERRAMIGLGSNESVAMASSQELGSTISTTGTTVLKAGRDINARQATVDAGNGLLSVHANRDLSIEAGEARVLGNYSAQWSKKKTFGHTDNKLTGSFDATTSVGSTFSGGLVSLGAKRDININGLTISGKEGVAVVAQRYLTVTEGRNTSSASAELAQKKRGISAFGAAMGFVMPSGNATTASTEIKFDTAAPSTISSGNGGVLLQGVNGVFLQGVQVDAAKDVSIQGGNVVIQAATNQQSVTGTTSSKKAWYDFGSMVILKDVGKGIKARETTADGLDTTTLTRNHISGANVSIAAADTLALAGTTIDTPGKVSLSADTLSMETQTTEETTRTSSQGRDVVYQVHRDKGSTNQTTNYNQINAASLSVAAQHVQAGLGARDSIEQLSKQPGMGWVEQLDNDPKFKGKIDWQRVDEVHKNWNYDKQGLTPEGGAIVTLVVAYLTAGAASGVGAAAGDAAGTAATGGVAALGEGGFIAAGGTTISAAVGGAVTAGISALASQAAVALINNQGDIAGALHDLGSSGNVKNLLTAIVTGGVLGTMDLDPTGAPTPGGGAQPFVDQLRHNLIAGAARAVVGTAVNGGSFEKSLKDNLKNALLDTAAAQAAYAIGDLTTNEGTLNDFTNKVAHAIAGCMVGAVRVDNAGGCGAGALGAAVGELAAQAYGRQVDTTQFAAVVGGLAVALTGGDAAQINLGSQAGSNAAANNYLYHDEAAMRERLIQERGACKTQECQDQKQAQIDAWNSVDRSRDRALKNACTNPTAKEACAGIYADLQAASASYDPTRGTASVPVSVRAEGESIGMDLHEYAFARAYPKAYGALTAGVETVEGIPAAPVFLLVLGIGAASGDASALRALADIAVKVAVTVTDLPAAVSAKLDEANAAEAAGNTTKATQIRAQLVLDGTLGAIGTKSLLNAMGWTGLGRRLMLNPIAEVADFDGNKMPTFAADGKYAYVRDSNFIATGANLEAAALRLVKDEVGKDFLATFDTKMGTNGFDLGYAKMVDGKPQLVIGEGKAGDSKLSALGENLERTLNKNLAKLKGSIESSGLKKEVKDELLLQLRDKTYQIELYVGPTNATKTAAKFDESLIGRVGSRPTRVIRFQQQ